MIRKTSRKVVTVRKKISNRMKKVKMINDQIESIKDKIRQMKDKLHKLDSSNPTGDKIRAVMAKYRKVIKGLELKKKAIRAPQ